MGISHPPLYPSVPGAVVGEIGVYLDQRDIVGHKGHGTQNIYGGRVCEKDQILSIRLKGVFHGLGRRG